MAQQLRILVAEDNRINQMLMLSLLKKLGHIVKVVNNGREAVEAVMAADFHIILMDIQMPEMDGEEACKEIRLLPTSRCATPIIAVTCDALEEHHSRYVRAGINGLISKPINWSMLISLIEAQTAAC